MTHTALAALADHLTHETALLQAFLLTLQDESQVLATPAVGDALDATTARKNQHAEDFAQAAEVRHALLDDLGIDDSTEDFSLAQVARQHPMLEDIVESLLELAQQARDLNEENGRIIDAYQQHNQEALAELQSLLQVRENRLYDAKGRARATNTQQQTDIKAG